ncbi:MAG: hypothetical protein JWM31_3347, partial [Solirubrobacterales bacterium]|nr:hypothetical protein [Solirubrobacterales bacterium]
GALVAELDDAALRALSPVPGQVLRAHVAPADVLLFPRTPDPESNA